MKKSMISVVVPIYNMEQYLDKCIESLLAQTYTDFELILVDDGSSDNCPIMCDEWEKKEEKIRVFHKPNGGLSSARNCGIDLARGEYIIFPDPDDWVEPNYLEKLIAIKEKYHADLSICGHYCGERINNSSAGNMVMTVEEALEQLMLPRSFCGYAWNKLYSMTTINENNMSFDTELGMVQDLHFNVRYFQLCKVIAYDPEPMYHYTVNCSGVSSRYTPLSPRKISGLKSYKKIAEITQDKYPKIEAIAYSSLCKMCLDDIMVYYRSGIKSKETRNLLWDEFLTYRKYFYNSDAYISIDKRCARFAVIHPILYYHTRRVYTKVYYTLKKMIKHQE